MGMSSRVIFRFASLRAVIALVAITRQTVSLRNFVRHMRSRAIGKTTSVMNSDHDTLSNLQRMSYNDFLWSRDWSLAAKFWADVVRRSSNDVPFVMGDSEFGVTNLNEVHAAGTRGEFSSADYRYSKRLTFALRIGYVGSLYNGYQRQANVKGVHTVEDDLKVALGLTSYGAGRTDANVSAVSQVISVICPKENTAEILLQRMRSSEPVLAGRLAVFDCVRVPKKFNARSCATWRRYLYMLPLNTGDFKGGFDIDIDFVNGALKRLENSALPYNGFAHQADRTLGEGLKDICILYRARAFEVDLNPLTSQQDDSCQSKFTEVGTNSEIVGAALFAIPHTPTSSALCIELVGSRFLRQMVRILVATVVRESVLPVDQRNANILVDICQSGNRYLAASAVPGVALCFAGVGYDACDLAIMKFMSKKNLDRVLAENKEMIARSPFRHYPAPVSPPSPATVLEIEDSGI